MTSPDHLSFSGTLRRSDGRVMIIRDSLSALESPTWGHSFAGSPRAAEPIPSAVRRCAEKQLGILNMIVEPLLPLLGNGSSSDSVLAEVHPSYIVTSDEIPQLADAVEARWENPLALGKIAREYPHEFSPLLVIHAMRLPFFGGTPHAFAESFLEDRATG